MPNSVLNWLEHSKPSRSIVSLENLGRRGLGRPFDRRLRLRDLSTFASRQRVAYSPLLQFYSAEDNIGNYTPVLGIQRLLGSGTDVWNLHRLPIDWDFINKNYRGVIVGGAGLFHKAFEPGWREIAENCTLPLILWGLGGCFVDDAEGSVVAPKFPRMVASRADLINVRDTTTANFYDFDDADVSPCPTLAWLGNHRRTERSKRMLYAAHTELVPSAATVEIAQVIAKTGSTWWYTNNYQMPGMGLNDLINRRYAIADRVITTRLHGAIIAAALGVPYVALAWDEKVRAWHREWGGGHLAANADALARILDDPSAAEERPLRADAFRCVEAFGDRAHRWVQTVAC